MPRYTEFLIYVVQKKSLQVLGVRKTRKLKGTRRITSRLQNPVFRSGVLREWGLGRNMWSQGRGIGRVSYKGLVSAAGCVDDGLIF